LTLDDLTELTDQPPYEIEGLLGGLFGRSVGSRIGATSAGYPDERVYLFTHETLRLVAEQQYGTSLAAYRDRLHTWADTYRQWGWPPNTPHYLLRSYPRMLTSNGDLPRLVSCATDQARHDRMRNLTGGDALALTEISTAQQLILGHSDPDLTSLALLAVQREHLTERNNHMPIELPAVWAQIGQPTRAEALANSIPDADRRAEALTRLVEAVSATGAHERAARLASEAEALTVQITNPNQRAWALTRLVEIAATHGDLERTARLAGEVKALTTQITYDPRWVADALTRLVEVIATSGDHERAEALTTQITDPE
ncbi:MAG: hypothetical protein H0U62_02080, partial [Actinobacteria bacterium]|nr:hypothetical protein [Actinomycetota bacterium]